MQELPVESSDEYLPLEQDRQAPWLVNPYWLVSWWDMKKFTADKYFLIAEHLGNLKRKLQLALRESNNVGLKKDSLDAGALRGVQSLCAGIGLNVSTKATSHLWKLMVSEKINIPAALDSLAALERTIKWEMEDRLFMFIPPDRADYYEKPELFGSEVNTRFPTLQFDITESGNCYTSGRSTAVVFHLMRVMESLVQEFANAIGGITLPADKDWHNILDEINREIKKLPGKDPRTIALAASAANLYHVKVAWRNPTMHPKQTYTMEEAEDIMRATKTFVKELTLVL